jgi:nucleotide-binding universal stress UspA family protein
LRGVNAAAQAVAKLPASWQSESRAADRETATYKRILVPIDDSQTARRGLKEAIALATEQKATLFLVHVVHDFPLMLKMSAARDFELDRGALCTHGRRPREDAKALAHSLGLEVETQFAEPTRGRVSDAIVAEAKNSGCDLIVIDTHGRRGIGRALLGSDAENVLRHSPVPMLLVRDAAGAD